MAATPARPSRTSDVHDSKVRRIAAITPDISRPKPHDSAIGALRRRPRIEAQYPLQESAGKSPNRERKGRGEKMRAALAVRAGFHLSRQGRGRIASKMQSG